MQFAASALLLLPGAPPLEDAVGFGRDGVADEPGHWNLRAVGVQGEAYVARRRVALEERLQAVELLLGLGVRYVGLHRAGVGLRATARGGASGASSARVGGGGLRVGGARTTWNACTLDSTVVLDAGGDCSGGEGGTCGGEGGTCGGERHVL